jgi:hypothetical protein
MGASGKPNVDATESYQNGNGDREDVRLFPPSAISIGSSSEHRPEERQRIRLCLVLTLFSVFFALTAVLAVWKAHLQAEHRASTQASYRAGQALKRLNRKTSHQAKHTASGCETTVLLMRHCEKHGPMATESDGSTQHCSYIGLERSYHLAEMFGPGRRYPFPSHLFALTPDRETYINFRQWETLHPLSEKSGTMIEIATHPHLANNIIELLRSGTVCGKIVVVSWKHSRMPELATLLGCGPDNGCPESYPDTDFDQVWQLKYVFRPDGSDLPKDQESKLSWNNSTDGHARARRRLDASISHSGWNVYATVTNQRFDPLAFSHESGDYPEGGAASGGRWKKDAFEL